MWYLLHWPKARRKVRTESPVVKDAASLRWGGPTPGFGPLCERLNAASLAERAARASNRTGGRSSVPALRLPSRTGRPFVLAILTLTPTAAARYDGVGKR